MSDRQDYFVKAQSWAESELASRARSQRIAWIVAAVASAIAFLLVLALVLLLPLKSVEPYVVTVDRQSGAVQVAAAVTPGAISQNETVIQAQLAGYVQLRETFDATDLRQAYRQVQLLSARDVSAAYIRSMAAANPRSPLRMLNKGDMLAVEIKSVSLIAPGSAIVRFQVVRLVPGGRPLGTSSYISAISYGFSGSPLRMEDRFDNPLGFQVTRYRRDVEGFAK
jgi:type IV secretion system protein VirB8